MNGSLVFQGMDNAGQGLFIAGTTPTKKVLKCCQAGVQLQCVSQKKVFYEQRYVVKKQIPAIIFVIRNRLTD